MNELKTGFALQNGKYRIERVLGQGGFGITYLAVQVNLNRKVAIKEFFMKELCNRDATTSHVSVPSTGSATTVERFRSKFVKEAQTIAGLDNPHIIRIHDIFNENGTAYYVMDYLGNGSLSDRVKSGGPMDAQTATTYIRQIGEALTYLHARSINHLDIKPSNILINASGEAIVIDFGLSKRYDESGTQTSSTPVGISHGYAPLEQYQPGGVSTFSPTADIYALGATLFYLLTATAPPNATTLLYDGFPAATLTSHNVAPTIAIIVEKAMQPLPKDRYASVAEMTSALDKALSTKTDEATVTANTNPSEATVIGATPTVAPQKPTTTSSKTTASSPKTPATTPPKPTASSHKAPATKPHIQWHWKRAALVMLLEYVAVIVHTSIFSQYSWFKGLWRMPTYAEMKELVEKCTWDWVKIPEGYYGETYGYRVTGPSGRSILLPARGYLRLDKRNGTYYTSKRREGHDAYYMTGTVNHAKPDGLYVHYLAIESNDSLGTHTAKMRSMSIEDAQHITMCIRAVHD